MVAGLTDEGVIRTRAVGEVLSRTPRHLFLPDVDVRTAYSDEAVLVKRGEDGSPISSASQPTIVATMLEQLEVSPGQRILEVGTGTGYNAALLASLAGVDGHVVTLELESDLADAAKGRLSQIGKDNVEVVVGDGRFGYPLGAPYHRVIVTAGARTVATPWTSQLAKSGRLVVPLVDDNGVGAVVVFDEVDGEMLRVAEVPCRFLPLRNGHWSRS